MLALFFNSALTVLLSLTGLNLTDAQTTVGDCCGCVDCCATGNCYPGCCPCNCAGDGCCAKNLPCCNPPSACCKAAARKAVQPANKVGECCGCVDCCATGNCKPGCCPCDCAAGCCAKGKSCCNAPATCCKGHAVARPTSARRATSASAQGGCACGCTCCDTGACFPGCCPCGCCLDR